MDMSATGRVHSESPQSIVAVRQNPLGNNIAIHLELVGTAHLGASVSVIRVQDSKCDRCKQGGIELFLVAMKDAVL